MNDFLDELLGYEQDSFGSGSSEPEYLTIARKNAMEADMAEKEQRRRLAQLESIISKNPREREKDIFNEIFQNKWGFNPSKNVGTKIGSTLLEVLSGALGGVAGKDGTARGQAQLQSQQDYKNSLEGYKQLLSSDNMAQKTANQADQNFYMNLLKQRELEEKARQANQKDSTTRKLSEDKLNLQRELGQEGLDIKRMSAEAQADLAKTGALLNITKQEDLQRLLDTKRKWDKEHPDVPFEMMASMNDQKMGIMGAMGAISKKQISDWLDIKSDLANETKVNKSNDVINKLAPVMELKDGIPVIKDYKQYQFKKGGITEQYKRKFGVNDDALTPNSSPPPTTNNPLAQKALGQVAPKPAQVLTEAALNSDPLQEAKILFQESKKPRNTTVVAGPGTTTSLREIEKERKTWAQSARILQELADNAGGGLASGDIYKYRGAINQNPLTNIIRTLSGRSPAEMQQVTKDMFAMAEHLKGRFNTGRPAYQMIEALEKAINNKYDTPESYAMAQMSVGLMAQMALKTIENPNFEKSLNKLDESYKGEPKGTWAESLNQVLKETIDNAKKNKKYLRVTPEVVFNRVVQNIENGRNKSSNTKGKNNQESVIDMIKRRRKEQGLDAQED